MGFNVDFGLGAMTSFYIDIYYTLLSYIYEDSKTYDLSNPADVFGTIVYITAEEITSIKIGANTVSPSSYYIQGDWLFFNESYLSTVLSSAGNTVDFDVYFDSGDYDTFTINAVQSGVNNPDFSQTNFNLDENNMPEYIETIITWNSASSISEMYVTYADNGFPASMPYSDYTVTPINAQTATLRIIVGGGKATETKQTDYFYVSIEIIFDSGSPSYLWLSMYNEYYYVDVEGIPWNGGYQDGGGEYNVGNEVTVQAYPNTNYTFVKWIVDDETEITDNPYTFTMPNHNINIKAIYLSFYPEVISSSPTNWSDNVEPNATIYLTFDRDIIEGTSANGFDDISLLENGMDPWTITDISIMNGNILVIVPSTMNINTQYQLNIPLEAIEDAASVGSTMGSPYFLSFNTGFGDYNHGSLDPDNEYYSLGNPADVEFNIVWGAETYLNDIIHYYWDEFDDYHELTLVNTVDYTIVGNVLTISNSFITSMNPEVGNDLSFQTSFESGWNQNFYINVITSTDPALLPSSLVYDLSNPENLTTNICFNSASSVSSVSLSAANLILGTDYQIEGTWLTINDSYLTQHLNIVTDEIVLTVTFNNLFTADLSISTIQSGLTNPTIDPQSATFQNTDFPEFLDITITWNDANAVDNLFVWIDEGGGLEVMEYPFYEVIPINSETALLRIDLNQGKKANLNNKTLQAFYVSIEIVFDIDMSLFYYLTVIEEYYMLSTGVSPVYGGMVNNYDDTYNVGEEVYLEAEPNSGYEFQNWRVDGAVVSTVNPYTFNMPNHDFEIIAYFVPMGTTMYNVVLSGLPIAGGTITGAGEFTEGEMVTISATPNTGWAFVNWTDNLSAVFATTAEYTFTMPAANVELTANFVDNSLVEQNEFLNQTIYPNPFSDQIIISNPETVKNVVFTTITGQVVAEYNDLENGHINTSDLPNGFYMLILESNNGKILVRKMIKQ
jgi:hypothetical protein